MKMFDKTDWKLLCKQKETILHLFFSDRLTKEEKENIDGLIEFIDNFQEAAETLGHPVLFLSEEVIMNL